jgi:FAD synthase
MQEHSTNNTKRSKYKYTYYQHPYITKPTSTHTHTLQNKLKQPQHNFNNHSTILMQGVIYIRATLNYFIIYQQSLGYATSRIIANISTEIY